MENLLKYHEDNKEPYRDFAKLILKINEENLGKRVYFIWHEKVQNGIITKSIDFIEYSGEITIGIKASDISVYYVNANEIFETPEEAQAFLDNNNSAATPTST